MLDTAPTAPAACASPEAARPSALAAPAVAGAQTARAVVTSADWPTDGRSYGRASVAYLGATYDAVVGLDPDCVVGVGFKTAPAVYVVDCDADHLEAWDAVEAAIAAAYDEGSAAA